MCTLRSAALPIGLSSAKRPEHVAHDRSLDALLCSLPPQIGKLNAMSQLFWREMRACFTKIGESTDVRVVWITAEGKVFTAGLDLVVGRHAHSTTMRCRWSNVTAN
jgi:hypothetical protein